jgi:signal transduction histidine kinase
VRGDPEALRQLTVNLVLNAVEAAGRQSAGRPRITVALERAGQDRAALHVRDTGSGPPPEVADRLFEPFISGKPEGTGLGLYVARQVVEGHHGSIRWQRHDGETCFTVELPLLERKAEGGRMKAEG